MGNTSSLCFLGNSSSLVKLIFWEGTTRVVTGKKLAGEIMFEFPNHMVCHANSFFIGHPIPSLSIGDELIKNETYFVLPPDCFPCNVLSASSLSSLASSPDQSPLNFKNYNPFEYIKGSNGRVAIRVLPEFLAQVIARGKGLNQEQDCSNSPNSHGGLCSTPELKRHYDQLVGSKDQVWSPKLDTISEQKIRFSPCRFLGLVCNQKK